MKVSKNLLFLVTVFLSVIVSGCVEGGSNGVEFEQTSGVEIDTLRAVPGSVSTGQEIELIVEAVNKGEREADISDAKIFGIPTGGGGNNWNVEGSLELGDPRPGDKDVGIQAVPVEDTVSLTPPDIERRIDPDVGLLVDYSYSTVASTTITVMTDELFRDEQPEKINPGLDNSAAPVQAELRAESPLRVSEEGKEICLVVKNSGSGKVLEEEVSISTDATGGVSLNGGQGSVELIDGRGSECYQISGLEANPETDIEIFFTVEYDYRIRETVPVTVYSSS